MALKSFVGVASSVATVIASATAAVTDTGIVCLRNATLYDPVPITLVNTGAVTIFVGPPGMTTATLGTPVASSGSMSFTLMSDTLAVMTSNGATSTSAFNVLAGRQF